MHLNRRQFLGGGLTGASLLLASYGQSSSTVSAGATTVLKRKGVREAGSLPYPHRRSRHRSVPADRPLRSGDDGEPLV